ncbi:MAG TPA: Na+/galactose cotransporter, partial [Bryobacteraceae bacterium]|nr:Na+/galactose cotransporter [Bryobacteraceae bacterium]
VSSVGMFAAVRIDPDALSIIALSSHAQALAEDMYRALWSCLIGVIVTIAVSLATKPKTDGELAGLVYGFANLSKDDDVPLLSRPLFWGVVALLMLVVLQVIFW